MDELINDFIAETRDMLQALGSEIVAWEAAPDDKARLDEIFRFVHTVKGNCGFFDLPRLQALSHAAEDVLSEVRSGQRKPDAALVDAVLAVIDRISELVQALETGEALASEDDALLIQALKDGPAPAQEAAEAPAQAVEGRKAQRSIRLSVDLLDRMMSGVSDAVLARNELSRRLREYPVDMAVEAAFERVSACIAEIRDTITRTRMQRIDSLFAGLPRMVRDISADLGKKVLLVVDGGDVELDREMIEMIRDPLTHMVRNAIDHGLEDAAARLAAGKSAAGTLKVSARQSGNQILIDVEDDGRGVDGDRLVQKALSSGILTPDRAERLTPAQKTALMFEAGISTAAHVTAISGRGVGMDVVRANIERIGGLVEVESVVGRGVRFTIRVPLTLTIIPALTVSAAGQMFAIPRAAIEEILHAGGHSVRLERLGDSRVAIVRGRTLPLVRLTDLLGVPAVTETMETIIILKPAGGDVYALSLTSVHDHEELVVKPAAPAVMAVGLYAGTTLADDGRPVLLLDPSGMAVKAGIRAAAAPPADSLAAEAAGLDEQIPHLLFHDLSGARRAVRLAVVERIEDVAADTVRLTAGRLRVVIGERILALAGCAKVPAGEKLRILRLSDGAAEIAYAFRDVIDIMPVSTTRSVPDQLGEVAGVALMGDEQVEVLNPYWLFANYGAAAPIADRPTCAMPLDDPWMAHMLRPLVESLGYRVVSSSGSARADLLIAGADAPHPPTVSAGAVLRLSATPTDEGIYRYDQEALLRALRSGVAGGRHG